MPDPWQEEVLRSASGRQLLNCSRQSGKSTVSSIKALHRAVFYPDSLVLLVSPSQRQSIELFRKVTWARQHMPSQPEIVEDNKLSLAFGNGSRIVALPGSEETIRGFSGVSLIIEDEASRCPDALYRSIRPMLAVSGGAFMLMTTPFGKRGHFFDEWTGPNRWERVEIPATQCPRISAEFLQEERDSMGDWWFKQEYMCEFGDSIDSLFTHDQVMGALSDVPALFGDDDESAADDDEVKALFEEG